MDDDLDPTPQGLLRCLQVLAEEAAFMSLNQTCAALQDAIAACREESEATAARAGGAVGAGLVH
jgi:hypothetical protein